MLFRIISTLLLIGVLAGFGYYFFKDTTVDLERFTLTNIKDVSVQGFTATGYLVMTSNLKIGVPIQSVAYQMTLEKTGEQISSGTMPPFVLEPGESKLEFEHRVFWKPTVELATYLVTEDTVDATISGKIRIDIPGVDSLEIPFEDTVDIKQYVTQFVTSSVPVQAPGVTDTVPAGDADLLPVDVQPFT